MKQKHEILFTPGRVGGVTVKNRFVHAPMEGTTPINWYAVLCPFHQIFPAALIEFKAGIPVDRCRNS